MTRLFLCLGALVALASCNSNSPDAKEQRIADMKRATDFHSYSKPSEAVTTHLSWEARVDFETRQIHATATYDMKLADDAELDDARRIRQTVRARPRPARCTCERAGAKMCMYRACAVQ